jgi:hypothetical protein
MPSNLADLVVSGPVGCEAAAGAALPTANTSTATRAMGLDVIADHAVIRDGRRIQAAEIRNAEFGVADHADGWNPHVQQYRHHPEKGPALTHRERSARSLVRDWSRGHISLGFGARYDIIAIVKSPEQDDG